MNWDKYKEYLYANLRPNTARLALKYGKKYSYVLERKDIKDLLVLPPAKQRHIMKALANLAKYTGVYEEWNRLRRLMHPKKTVVHLLLCQSPMSKLLDN